MKFICYVIDIHKLICELSQGTPLPCMFTTLIYDQVTQC